MIVGKLVESAARSSRNRFSTPTFCDLDTMPPISPARAGNTSPNLARCNRSPNTNTRPIFTGMTQTYRGDAYGAYAWGIYVAEVSVDTRTAETRVEDFVALQESRQSN